MLAQLKEDIKARKGLCLMLAMLSLVLLVNVWNIATTDLIGVRFIGIIATSLCLVALIVNGVAWNQPACAEITPKWLRKRGLFLGGWTPQYWIEVPNIFVALQQDEQKMEWFKQEKMLVVRQTLPDHVEGFVPKGFRYGFARKSDYIKARLYS